MGQTESRTVVQGELPRELSHPHILRNDISDRPPFAPQFAPYTPKTLYKVKCPFSINMKSINLVPITEGSKQYAISFSGQCSEAFSLQIFTFAKEEMEPSLYTKSINLVSSGNINRPSPPIHTIDTIGSFSFNGRDSDIGIVSLSDIEQQEINLKDTWSAIIRLNLPTHSEYVVHSLLVYCAMKIVNETPKIMIIGQKCLIQNRGFYITEMYGLGDMSRADGESNECVICMSNERNTCVLPCRHICCCAECANTLRLQMDRCPVCRELMSELVYLTVNPDYMNAKKDAAGQQSIELQTL